MAEISILLVEDEEVIRESLARELHNECFLITAVGSGSEALNALDAREYDVVITDLMMPDVNGLDVLKTAKKLAPLTSVIIISGYGDMQSAIEFFRLGADDFTHKPCETEELVFRIRRCLEKRNLLIELQSAEKILAHTSDLLERTSEMAKVGGWELDLRSMNLSWTRETYRIHDCDPAVIPSLDQALDFYSPEDKAKLRAMVQAGIENGRPWDYTLPMTTAKGHSLWVRGQGFAEMARGKAIMLRGTFQDITERKRTEEALQEVANKYQLVFDSAYDAIFICDLQERILEVNALACERLGFTHAELLSMQVGQIDAPGEAQSVSERIARVLEQGHFMFETLHQRKNGTTVSTEVSARQIVWDRQPAIMSICRDITDRQLAEQKYQRIFHEMLDGFALHEIICDADGKPVDYRFLAVNPAFERMTGLKEENIVGRTVLETLPETEAYWIEAYGRVALTGVPIHFENYASDLKKHFEVAAFRPAPNQFACTIIDITERKQAEEELQRNESRLKRMVDILQHPSKTIQELLDYALEQAIQLTGSKIGYVYHYHEDRKELELNSWSKDVLPECAIANPKTCYELDKTGIWGEAVRQRRPFIVNEYQTDHPLKKGYPEGHVQLLKFVTIPIFKGERIVSVVGLANKETDYDQTDILQISLLMDGVWKAADNIRSEEENLKLETQLVQAQKMEAIGTLAGGIAHDFNNILGAVLGYAEMAKDAALPGSAIAHDVDKVLEAGERAANLVKQILAFSRQENIERISLKPGYMVKEAIKLLRPALPSTITIRQKTDTVTGSILADPTQFHQILMNLCTNAFHAMELTGGILEISLRDYELSSEDLNNQPRVQPGRFVVLSIGDSGPGIDPKIRDRIFEPYFTTKGAGKGTGMGLAISYGIVSSYGGFITCESELGKGTLFKVFFPAIEEKEVPGAKPVKATPLGKERILFVDDEEMLAELGRVMLERLGYEVTVRTNSLEALSTFQRHPNRFDAVITDQTMPGMTGMELARQILQIQPKIPIILCTGYSTLINEGQAKNEGVKAFTAKPLTKKGIAILLRSVLDSK